MTKQAKIIVGAVDDLRREYALLPAYQGPYVVMAFDENGDEYTPNDGLPTIEDARDAVEFWKRELPDADISWCR